MVAKDEKQYGISIINDKHEIISTVELYKILILTIQLIESYIH